MIAPVVLVYKFTTPDSLLLITKEIKHLISFAHSSQAISNVGNSFTIYVTTTSNCSLKNSFHKISAINFLKSKLDKCFSHLLKTIT